MRGSVYRKTKPDGTKSQWYAVTDRPPGPDGRRRQKTTTHPTKKAAERAVADRIRAMASGNYFDNSITVAEYLDGWLAAKQTIRATTRMSYQQHINDYLRPHLGRILLVNLRVGLIEDMYAAIRSQGNLSNSSIRRLHATLRGALNTAVRRNLIPVNPATHVELAPSTKHAVEVWSPTQVRQFLDANQDERLIALFHLLALRGLRRGEALGLRWEDLDLDQKVLRVAQQLVEVGTELVFGPPKTKTGTRTVSLDDTTVAVLRAHRARQSAERLAFGQGWIDNGLVFTREDGTPVRPNHATSHFPLMITKAGLPKIRLHDLRHTSASLGLQSGESLKEVSDRLGHSSIVITADTYAHIAPELAQESADRVARLVSGQLPLDGR